MLVSFVPFKNVELARYVSLILAVEVWEIFVFVEDGFIASIVLLIELWYELGVIVPFDAFKKIEEEKYV